MSWSDIIWHNEYAKSRRHERPTTTSPSHIAKQPQKVAHKISEKPGKIPVPYTKSSLHLEYFPSRSEHSLKQWIATRGDLTNKYLPMDYHLPPGPAMPDACLIIYLPLSLSHISNYLLPSILSSSFPLEFLAPVFSHSLDYQLVSSEYLFIYWNNHLALEFLPNHLT